MRCEHQQRPMQHGQHRIIDAIATCYYRIGAFSLKLGKSLALSRSRVSQSTEQSSVDSKNPILLLHRATAELCWPRSWLPDSFELLAMAIFGNSVGNIIVTAVITWTLQRRYVVFATHLFARYCSCSRGLSLQCCFGNQAAERLEMFHHYSSWGHLS